MANQHALDVIEATGGGYFPHMSPNPYGWSPEVKDSLKKPRKAKKEINQQNESEKKS